MTWRDDVDALCEEGNRLQDAGDLDGALAKFEQALALVPDPDTREIARAGWIFVALADVLYAQARYAEARPYNVRALLAGGFGNPFVHLRQGQISFELGDVEGAAEDLLRALLIGGEKMFDGEHAKYWEFITAKARPPEGTSSWRGWAGAVVGSELHEWLLDADRYFGPRARSDGG